VDNTQAEQGTDTQTSVQAAHVIQQKTSGGGKATTTQEDFAVEITFRIPFGPGPGKRIMLSQ
jgi:hypothetical protein